MNTASYQAVTSVELMRDSDAFTIDTYVDDIELMRRAGEAIFNLGQWSGSIALVCGPGNNGGDGFVCAHYLAQHHYSVDVFYTKEPSSVSSTHFFNQIKEEGINLVPFEATTSLDAYDTILDCLLGTGFAGEPCGLVANAIDAINHARTTHGSFVIAADINSGCNGNTGCYHNAVISDLTITVGYLKLGMFLDSFAGCTHAITNADIGISLVGLPYLLPEADVFTYLCKSTHAVDIEAELTYETFVSTMNKALNDRLCYCVHGTSNQILFTPQQVYLGRPSWM